MILHHVALALLLVVAAHHVLSGDLARWLLKHAQKDDTGNKFYNATISMFFISILWIGVVPVLLLFPGAPTVAESGFGIILIIGALTGAIFRRTLTLRPFLVVVSGMLILVGNYL